MNFTDPKVRAQAILILDIAASHAYDSAGRAGELYVSEVGMMLGASRSVQVLANDAYTAVAGMSARARGEAAGLLRDGWLPGEPVVAL